jgi:hypothetical protein
MVPCAAGCGKEIRARGNKSGLCAGCVSARSSRPTAPIVPPTKEGSKTLSVTGDKAELGLVTRENVRTLADLIRVCEIDISEWEIERWIANKWEVGTKDPDGHVRTTPLFQIKAWLKQKGLVIRARDEIAALIADAKTKISPRPSVKRGPSGPHMLEIAIPDLHLGKLAWSPETGHGNYDSKIAADIFRTALEALIARTAAFKFEQIVFPIGNDFFHSDTKQGTTTSGTQLDNDSRYHKTFVAGRKLLTEAIERLRQLAPVTVVAVPGNHDALGVYHVADSLECLYHNTPDVKIMNDPVPRKYVDYGRNLILFTHGDKGKNDKLPLLMATERPVQFGNARFREAHIGHRHELRLQEHMGVRVRTSPALCAADAWHSEQHFVGNLRSAEAFVWSREDGIVAMATYTVREDRRQEAAS